MKNQNNGITLIALVITIIILLILAGISIASLTGSGLFEKAKQAKEKSKIAEYQEALELIGNSLAIEKVTKNLSGEEYIQRYKEEIQKDDRLKGKVEIIDNEDGTINVKTKEGYIYKVTEKGVKYIEKCEENSENGNDKLKIEVEDIAIVQGESSSLNINFTSENENKQYVFSSSDEAIATVDTSGNVTVPLTAVAGSTANIIVREEISGAEGLCTISVLQYTGIAENVLKVDKNKKTSPYVYYNCGNGNKALCRVLYDSSSSNGLQLVSVNNLEKYYYKSENNLNGAIKAYNSFIKNLNDKAATYINLNLSNTGTVRCVGSNPKNPYMESTEYFTSNESEIINNGLNGVLKVSYDATEEDKKQLSAINALGCEDNSSYWVCKRSITAFTDEDGIFEFSATLYQGTKYGMNGGTMYISLGVYEGGLNFGSNSSGLRVVFGLKSNLKISNGSGTKDSPYEFE